MKRNTLQNHIRQFGADGRFTYHAGLTVEQAAEIGPAAVRKSTLHEFKEGDWVVIRGTTVAVPVVQTDGMFLFLRSYGWGGFREFYAVNPPHGTYSYGRIGIYKGHVELAEVP